MPEASCDLALLYNSLLYHHHHHHHYCYYSRQQNNASQSPISPFASETPNDITPAYQMHFHHLRPAEQLLKDRAIIGHNLHQRPCPGLLWGLCRRNNPNHGPPWPKNTPDLLPQRNRPPVQFRGACLESGDFRGGVEP